MTLLQPLLHHSPTTNTSTFTSQPKFHEPYEPSTPLNSTPHPLHIRTQHEGDLEEPHGACSRKHPSGEEDWVVGGEGAYDATYSQDRARHH